MVLCCGRVEAERVGRGGEPLLAGEVRWSLMLHFALVAVLTVLLSLFVVFAMFYALRRWL
jgi:hypothetical protein